MPKRRKRWLRRGLKLLAVALLVNLLLVLSLRWLEPPTTAFMVQRQLAAGAPVQQQWVSIQAVSTHLAVAVIAAEDQNFATHFGFDTASIKEAWKDRRSGKRQRGASTITQQLAKNLFLWSGQGRLSRWTRKGFEAWFTIWLELLLSKQRILELYLNFAEFGDRVYGAEAAAKHYFSKSARQLSRREAALLAAVLPSPRRYQIAPPSPYLLERAQWIEAQSRQLGGRALLDSL